MNLGRYSSLSDQIVRELQDRIFDGRLAPGQRVNEVELARECGVSRSPLREALVQLSAEGAATHLPRRGFFINALTVEEARQIYPVRAALDPMALRLAGLPDDATLARVERIKERLRVEPKPQRIVELDDQWHYELWRGCGNEVVIDLIQQFMRRTRRYELVLMSESRSVDATVETKSRMAELLRHGELDGACRLLAHRLTASIEPVCELLERHKQERSSGVTA